MKVDVEERANRGMEMFKKGYNCSQSVVAAFADLYDIDESTALKIAASFGGGLGRMRLTCGCVSGMAVLAGLENGTDDGSDNATKMANYQLVQALANKYKENTGSVICAELLGLAEGSNTSPQPEARTPQYYHKRPCKELVGLACRIYAEHLNEE